MVSILDELKQFKQENVGEKNLYSNFSSNLDLFVLNYGNILKYFTKLVLVKLYKVSLALL
jgi:hypothetical protein